MELSKFQEQVFFSTVRITVSDEATVGASIGTGFLFNAAVSESKTCILLISNKHVFQNPTKTIELIFHTKDPTNHEKPLLGSTHILRGQNYQSVYTEHPDSDVDLACLIVTQITDPALNIFYKTVNETLLPDFSDANLLPGNEVWFVGYPENRFDTKHNLPILRRGYIASIPKVDFEGRQEFLIDAQVFQGSSGSPVFSALGGKFKLIGVVSQTMIRNERIQAVPTSKEFGVNQILGLGIVLKSGLIRDLLEVVVEKINRLQSGS